MTEPLPPGEDLELRVEALELLVGLLIGQLRATEPQRIATVESSLARYVLAEQGRAGREAMSREVQVATRTLERLQAGQTGDAAELLAGISDL